MTQESRQGKYRNPRIAFISNQESKDFLEGWAEEENRTVSNLVTTIVEEAIAEKKTGKSSKEALALALDLIQTLVNGKEPSLAQIAKLAHETDLTEEELIKLKSLFRKNGEKAGNGH